MIGEARRSVGELGLLEMPRACVVFRRALVAVTPGVQGQLGEDHEVAALARGGRDHRDDLGERGGLVARDRLEVDAANRDGAGAELRVVGTHHHEGAKVAVTSPRPSYVARITEPGSTAKKLVDELVTMISPAFTPRWRRNRFTPTTTGRNGLSKG